MSVVYKDHIESLSWNQNKSQWQMNYWEGRWINVYAHEAAWYFTQGVKVRLI